MKAKNFFQKFIFALGHVMPGAVLLLLTREAEANPTGMTVQAGNATFNINGSTLTVSAANNAMLNWQSFNIGAGEHTVFNQPSASSIVWNRINDQSPSQIYGSLQANGVVVLLNSSGFYFGPNSFVSAAGLVVSTANCTPPQNAGGAWVFNGPPPLASIVNFGQIKIGNGGDCFFIADKIENHGDVEAPGGSIQFAAGQTVTLSERPDGRGMSMKVELPQGSVDNYGNVIADGGIIALNAKVVNQNGFIQANSVQNKNGVIELVASDELNLGADSNISASGGEITLKSGGTFNDVAGSRIAADGGAIVISAPNVASLNSKLSGDSFLLDPVSLLLGNSTAGGAIDVTTAFAGFANILLQASGTITLADGLNWNLSGSTGKDTGSLALQAADIILGAGSLITDAKSWSVSLAAGTGSILFSGNAAIQTMKGDVNLLAGKDITVGSGYVITKGGGNITAHALTGNIDTGSFAQGYRFKPSATTLATAYDLSGGLGGISTMAGGDVNLIAGGDVRSVLPGTDGKKKGYFYNGNFIVAGGDFATAGAGAFGKQAGNVNIVAGGDVAGHFVVANGTGKIFAGVQMDASGNPMTDGAGKYILGATGNAGKDLKGNTLALSVVKGGWDVTAGNNINLQEVSNPNGLYNISGALKHFFDYGASDFVNLSAANAVQIGGNSSTMLRLDTPTVPMIFPGILNIVAGAGGVTFNGDATFKQLILFPSPQGGLVVNTTDGGTLSGRMPTISGAPQIFQLVISDSGSSQFKNSTSFGVTDHAATPVHLGSEQPVQLNISGDMNLLSLSTPEAAQINVVGYINNSRFQGMNLNGADATTINVGQAAKTAMENNGALNAATDGGLTVGGDINNRSAFTSIDLSQVVGAIAPDLSLLARSQNSTFSAATLLTSFYYNPTTHLLTYQNINNTTFKNVLTALQSLTVQKVDSTGKLLWLDAAQTVPDTEVISIFNAATATALQKKYDALGAVPTDLSGWVIGGGGQFNINARNLDLGTTAGIQSKGVGFYRGGSGYPLANYFNSGADINLNLTGDLSLYSSAIASLNGGRISIDAGGSVNVGSSEFNVSATGARGIFSAARADVSVIADGNVNVNGSRIAAYDGGNVTVESRHGNINAGSGGSGFVTVNSFYVDPITHVAYPATFVIPGSGILATTFPPRDSSYPAPENSVGNILVETPNGNISASKGGIVQLPLNGADNAGSIVAVLAGYEMRDSSGHAVSAAEIADGTAVLVSDGRNLDASGSGVIAQNAVLKASGKIDGVIFARGNIDLAAVGNVNVTALAQGNVNVNSGGTISGTIIGVGGVSASGGSIEANLESNNGISGDTSGAKGFAQGTAASAAATAASNETTATTEKKSDDEDLAKKKKGIALAQKVSRVTVQLPAKN